MKGELFFQIPDDQEVMVKLVEAIPSDWLWVDGGLYAPNDLIISGAAQENTGFAMDRFHNINPCIIGSYDKNESKRKKPDLFAIMVEQKLPGFITFNEAGYDPNFITLGLAKRVAVGFLRKGYRGGLYFFRGCCDYSKYSNPARCSIIFEPWDGVCREEAGAQPARVKLEWETHYRGKKEDVAPIVAVCRSLNLREYAPAASAEVVTV